MSSFWFWEKDSVEYEIFKKYERALVTLGVDFSLEQVQETLEACTYGLEDALRSTIVYVLWLQKNEKQYFSNAILVSALREQWKPKAWRDEYLKLPNLESPGQRWWNNAASMWGYDVRNQLVADVFYDHFLNSKFKIQNAKLRIKNFEFINSGYKPPLI